LPAEGKKPEDQKHEESEQEQQEQLALILDEYLQGLERGEPLEPADVLARHPEVADRLRGYLSGLALFHQAALFQQAALERPEGGRQVLRGQLGDFRLVREIGRGGMGVVYECVQISLGRRVALKVLPASIAIHEKQIARFKNEAQAAAQIDHPNIVPVFAIGQERGLHYFAMQLIGGQSLGQVLEQLRQEAQAGADDDAAGRVQHVARLGVQVAGALHAAHEIGVVHRDVKPSNLLLDEKGKVWITDFGVARCRTSDDLTETGQAVGTMAYMSPEQAGGNPALVDQRTDIYSLGVTLYELATLRHPADGAADAATAFEASRTHWRRPRQWNAAIPVDFENIVLKAIAEERDDRYATARDLAEDLQRFLDGEPIAARPPSLAVRLGKWAVRRKRWVGAAAVALAAGVLGMSVSLAIIATERAAKDRAYQAATQNHRQAREMLDRVAQVAEGLAAEVPGSERVRQELLKEMLPYYEKFASEAAADPKLQADLAITFSKIGDLNDQIGSLDDAEQAYRQARTILEQLVHAQPAQPEHQRSLARCCNNLGQLLRKRGDVAAARAELQQALRLQQRLAERWPRAAAHRADLAATHGNLGLLADQAGDTARAAEHYRSAIRIQESIRHSAPEDDANLNHLAASYNSLAALYLEAQPQVAREWVERALVIQLKLARSHPLQRAYQSDLALTYNNLGAIFSRLDHAADAERCFRDAIALQQRLLAAAPLVAHYRRDLAVSWNNLGLAQMGEAEDLAEAQESFEKALALQQDLVAARPQDVTLLSGLGGMWNNLGLARQKQGELAEASDAFQRAIAAQRRALDRSASSAAYREALSKHYFNFGQALLAQGQPADAAEAALARGQLWPRDPRRLLRVAEELAVACQQMPPGESRQRYVAAAAQTVRAARSAGLANVRGLRASPVAALLTEAGQTGLIEEVVQ
jgi:tetratricopeptide (TPR) repeat protein